VELIAFNGAGGSALNYISLSRYLRDIANIRPLAIRHYYEQDCVGSRGRWEAMAQALAQEMQAIVRGRYSLIGHSLGARVAYEVAKQLSLSRRVLPECLILLACRGPNERGVLPPVHTLNDATLLAKLCDTGAMRQHTAAVFVASEDKMKRLRYEVELAEAWPESKPEALPIDLIAVAGSEDLVDTYESVISWQNYTTKKFVAYRLPGGHYFHQSSVDKLGAIIKDHLET